MSRPFNSQDLEFLRVYARFGSWGEPALAARFLSQLLRLTPFPDHKDELARLLPGEGLANLVAYMADACGVLSHGCGIGGSWISAAGEVVLVRLHDIDWNLPFKSVPLATIPAAIAADLGPEYNNAFWEPLPPVTEPDPTPPSIVRYSREYNNVFWDAAPAAAEPDAVDKICSASDLCGCGTPLVALKLYADLLRSIQDRSAEVRKLVPDPGMLQFMLYQLEASGITGGIDGGLTVTGEWVKKELASLDL